MNELSVDYVLFETISTLRLIDSEIGHHEDTSRELMGSSRKKPFMGVEDISFFRALPMDKEDI